MHILQEMSEQAGYVCQAYTGRGMYGSSCLGVVVTNLGNFIGELTSELLRKEDLSEDEKDDFIQAMKTLKLDAMGKNTIVYFPIVAMES